MVTGIEMYGLYWAGVSASASVGYILRGIVDSWRNERAAYHFIADMRRRHGLEAEAYLTARQRDRIEQAMEEARHEQQH